MVKSTKPPKEENTSTQQKELEFSLSVAKLGFWKLNLKTLKAEHSLLHDQIFGYSKPVSGWTYNQFLDHVYPEDLTWVEALVEKKMKSTESWQLECRICRADNQAIRWIWVAGQSLKLNAENYLLGLVQDVTERKQIEIELRNMNSKFQTILESIPDALLLCDSAGKINLVNANAENIFGYTQAELLGKPVEFLIPQRYVAQHQKNRNNYIKQPHLRPMGAGLDLYAQHKDGHEIPVEISLSPIQMYDGLLIIVVVRDITERKKDQDAKAMLSALVESSDEAIIGKDLNGIIFSWNKAAELLYGYTEAEIKGCSIQLLFPPGHEKEFSEIIQQILRGEHIKHKESVRIHKDGHLIPVSITISPIKNARGVIIGASTTARDITEQKQIEQKLRHLAEHDSLTGLINRVLLEDRLNHAILLADRHHEHLAVLFLDLDNFKQVNDQYGHAVGDALLCATADCLLKCIRGSDTLARLGGDEFVILLTEIKDEQYVLNIAKKIKLCLEKGYVIQKNKFQMTASIGIALYPKEGREMLIQKADAAMYYAKKHGKNGVKLYDSNLELAPHPRLPPQNPL